MIRSYSNCLILAAVFQVIFGNDSDFDHSLVPKHCWHAPRGVDLRKCCPRPRLYSDKLMKHCGIEPMKNNRLNEIDHSKPKSIRKKPCQDGICLMQNANLLNTNGSIDYKKLGIYLDEWAAANPDFTEAILAAKLICGKEKDESWYRSKTPPLCDQDGVYLCLMSHMLWNCKLKEFEECQILREHLNECRPFFINPRKRLKTNTKNSKNE